MVNILLFHRVWRRRDSVAYYHLLNCKYSPLRHFGWYCDDWLVLWTSPLEKLELFQMFLNSIHSNLQVTIEVVVNESWFLDLKLTLKDNKIQTAVYNKSTSSYLYLQADSRHHLPSILEIQKGVTLRLHKICSTEEEYSNESRGYKAYLTGRGHKLKIVKKPFNNVLNMSWQQSRIKKTKSANSKNRIAFCSNKGIISRALLKSMFIFLTIVK